MTTTKQLIGTTRFTRTQKVAQEETRDEMLPSLPEQRFRSSQPLLDEISVESVQGEFSQTTPSGHVIGAVPQFVMTRITRKLYQPTAEPLKT